MSKDLNLDNSEMRREILIQRITNHICDDGCNREKILQLMANNREFDLTENEVNTLIDVAIERLNALYNTQEYRREVVENHPALYEHIYAYFKKIGYTQGANKALQAKEKLLNILKEGNRVTLKKSETIIHQSSEPEYDLDKLSPEQREKLNDLMKKMSS